MDRPLAHVRTLPVSALVVRRWSGRVGWGAEQRLALATGAASFFLLLAPLLETSHPGGKNTTGMTLMAVLWLLFFVLLARRLGRAPMPSDVLTGGGEARC